MGKIIESFRKVGNKVTSTFRPADGLKEKGKVSLDIFKANETIARLEHELEATKQSNTLTPSNVDNGQATLSSDTLKQLETKYSLEIEKLKSEYEAKLLEATKQVELAKKSVNAEAARIVASLGIQIDELPKMTQEDFLTKNKNGFTVINH